MRPSPAPLGVMALACLFSCSFVGPPARPPSQPAEEREAEVHGPTAVEWVEAKFHMYQTALSPGEIRQVAEGIVAESRRNDLDWELVLAVIHTESGFYNFAVSNVGALGLMQIMPSTGETLAKQLRIGWGGREMLFQPLVNVKMGTRYLADLYARYGSWDRALAAYNWGPARIDWRLRRGRALPVGYVHKVLAQVQSPASP